MDILILPFCDHFGQQVYILHLKCIFFNSKLRQLLTRIFKKLGLKRNKAPTNIVLPVLLIVIFRGLPKSAI